MRLAVFSKAPEFPSLRIIESCLLRFFLCFRVCFVMGWERNCEWSVLE